MSLAGLAFQHFTPELIDFEDGDVVRVATDKVSVYRVPSGNPADITSTWYRDDLIHVYKEVTAPPATPEPGKTLIANPNPIWYRVWGGYAWRGRLQRVKTIYNVPLSSIPAASIPGGKGILAEVTVPFTEPWRHSTAYGWQPLDPKPEDHLWRLYYGTVHWVDAVESGPPVPGYDGPWYRIWDHIASFPYYVPAMHLRPIPPEVYAPLSSDVPPDQKHIDVNLSQQSLTAYEHDQAVFKTAISSGLSPNDTHQGRFEIRDKLPSELMGEARLSQTVDGYYQLPGVPWTSYIAKVGENTDGQAFHGTYWHDNFGTPMSHGCVNMRTSEALWLFRWATPLRGEADYDYTLGRGTAVNVHF